jgi:hypothetical protein
VKTVKIQGGLGNQLFGLAFARSVVKLSGEAAALDMGAYRADRYGRIFDLADLAMSLGLGPCVRRPLLAGRIVGAVARRIAPPGYVAEGAPPADEAALAGMIARGRYFDGYWQHEAYIAGAPGLIAAIRDVVFRRAAAAARAGPAERAGALSPAREVVIHYRTYKEERRPGARGVPDSGYVRAALAHVDERLGPGAPLWLVSDDPGLALARLGNVGRPIGVLAGGGAWEDMAVLMRARALILTNSSFSWWGGFCGDAEVVTYPRRDGLFHYPIPAARFACL